MQTTLSPANMALINNTLKNNQSDNREETKEIQPRKGGEKMLAFGTLALAAIGIAGIGICSYKYLASKNPINKVLSESEEIKNKAKNLLEEVKEIRNKADEIKERGEKLELNNLSQEIIEKSQTNEDEITFLFDTLGMFDGALIKKSDGTQDAFVFDTSGAFKFVKNCTIKNKNDILIGNYEGKTEFVFYTNKKVSSIYENIISKNNSKEITADVYYGFFDNDTNTLRIAKKGYYNTTPSNLRIGENFYFDENETLSKYDNEIKGEYVEFDKSGKIKK